MRRLIHHNEAWLQRHVCTLFEPNRSQRKCWKKHVGRIGQGGRSQLALVQRVCCDCSIQPCFFIFVSYFVCFLRSTSPFPLLHGFLTEGLLIPEACSIMFDFLMTGLAFDSCVKQVSVSGGPILGGTVAHIGETPT